MSKDYLQYYDLESYLFNTARRRFHENGRLPVEDFFCIIIWKANRSKTTVAEGLREGQESLAEAVRKLTSGLFQRKDAKERLRFLMKDWCFLLPMATAILTVSLAISSASPSLSCLHGRGPARRDRAAAAHS